MYANVHLVCLIGTTHDSMLAFMGEGIDRMLLIALDSIVLDLTI